MAIDLFVIIIALIGMAAALEILLTFRDQRKYPPPGTLIDIGGRRLHVLCMGEAHGASSVILEAGSLGFSAKWDMVQCKVAHFARVYSYDRAGYGWSDRAPAPLDTTGRTTRCVIEELYRLITNAQIPMPCILVGHDIGGHYIRQFARRYPRLVAGIVLVDSFHPAQWASRQRYADEMRTARLSSFIGIVRFENWLRYHGLPMSKAAKGASIGLHSRGLQNSASWEILALEPEHELENVLGDKPVVVLTQTLANNSFGQEWGSLQADFLRLSPNSKLCKARNSGHLVHLEEPDLVVNGIRQVVDAVCSGKALSHSWATCLGNRD